MSWLYMSLLLLALMKTKNHKAIAQKCSNTPLTSNFVLNLANLCETLQMIRAVYGVAA